ncbi:hypothetical protein FA09DRAFT_146212 [Tilletiopsis washingtonensis]|uniref:Cytochrome c oxidase, subunit VIb n=1 Tax=Tilletiopsis washingtonensis TaxID=58919 RepID=A0A316Z1R0_9BASI|nr:hypothetical protein FA09DRAFT_146212 [Tilletiopsis washingtonensis]PWN95296.1 hypothetical protein FA09DRAFT_146212 [Tilletiopsis washingtonensis]
MGFFSSSPSSSSSSAPVAGEGGSLPTRSSRTACWDARDAYYACLTQRHVVIPPGTDMSDGRGPVGKAAAQAQRQRAESLEEQRLADPCAKLRGPYEGNCAKSWVDYFNKRRVLEERQRLMYESGALPSGSGAAPGAGPA